MRDALSQYLIPLLFVLIWAVTSILNRDGQPLPQRANRPGQRPGGAEAGPRRDPLAMTEEDDSAPAVAPPPRRPAADPRLSDRPTPITSRPARPGPDRAGVPGRSTADDDVVFIEGVRRSAGGAPSLGSPRRPARGRRSEPAPARPRRNESETQRVLSEQVGRSMAQNRGQALGLSPISANLSSLSGASLRDASSTAATVTPSVAPPALTAVDVRRMAADGSRLREMALLVEILQPPVSRRPRRLG